MKLIHFADAHFEKDKLDKCVASANFIVERANEIQPDLIVSAGDIFNRLQTLNSKSAVTAAKSFIMRLAEIAPVVMVKGNEAHDSAGCLEIFKDLESSYPIFTTERAETIWLTNSGLFVTEQPTSPAALIHLLSYPEKAWFLSGKESLSIDESNRLIQEALQKIFAGFGAISMDAKCPVILLGHGNIAGARLCSGQDLVSQDIMLSKHDLMQARADIQCWGHIHECQEVSRYIWYSGSTNHNNWGEVTPRFILLHEIERGSCQTTKIQIPSRPLSLHEAMWDPKSGWDDDGERDWEGAELRIRVRLLREHSDLITDEQIQHNYPGAHSYKIERIIVPEERLRAANIVKARTLAEKVTEWGSVVDKDVPPEVLELAGEVERSVGS